MLPRPFNDNPGPGFLFVPGKLRWLLRFVVAVPLGTLLTVIMMVPIVVAQVLVSPEAGSSFAVASNLSLSLVALAGYIVSMTVMLPRFGGWRVRWHAGLTGVAASVGIAVAVGFLAVLAFKISPHTLLVVGPLGAAMVMLTAFQVSSRIIARPDHQTVVYTRPPGPIIKGTWYALLALVAYAVDVTLFGANASSTLAAMQFGINSGDIAGIMHLSQLSNVMTGAVVIGALLWCVLEKAEGHARGAITGFAIIGSKDAMILYGVQAQANDPFGTLLTSVVFAAGVAAIWQLYRPASSHWLNGGCADVAK